MCFKLNSFAISNQDEYVFDPFPGAAGLSALKSQQFSVMGYSLPQYKITLASGLMLLPELGSTELPLSV